MLNTTSILEIQLLTAVPLYSYIYCLKLVVVDVLSYIKAKMAIPPPWHKPVDR